jgi:hypothetical protein
MMRSRSRDARGAIAIFRLLMPLFRSRHFHFIFAASPPLCRHFIVSSPILFFTLHFITILCAMPYYYFRCQLAAPLRLRHFAFLSPLRFADFVIRR